MSTKIISHAPLIPVQFNPHLLSMPSIGFSAEKLHKIAKFLKKKINSPEFKKFTRTREILENKQQHFMELYERAKIEEGKTKEKTCFKTQWFGYRPRIANRHNQRLFERLNDRAYTSAINSRHNKI